MIRIVQAGKNELQHVTRLAAEIWPVCYKDIITPGQIDYMLGLMYTQPALEKQMDEGQEFVILIFNDKPVGFAAYGLLPDDLQTCKLYKIYVSPALHGNGLGKALLTYVEQSAKEKHAQKLTLNVNKDNPAKSFYVSNGFVKTHDVVIDIGNGYVMDDFVMVKDLPSS